ncbi:hypothetical protein HM1_1477 [Heliomicrobium modesticaldum Ice1]|uniref:Uncharacterized protein n=1 Tax=Heliobacterium modesticaldum (strain ATCC 51547 / Ice1) TaxID=498761 RepID=B0TCM4_HELMI|nr:hypothetical protein HM1_1477 [Heliomicrobium modesticaldum Ice1]
MKKPHTNLLLFPFKWYIFRIAFIYADRIKDGNWIVCKYYEK